MPFYRNLKKAFEFKIGDTSQVLLATTSLRLYWWAFYCAIRAEYATITRFGPQQRFARRTLIEILTGICRHDFPFGEMAERAS